MQYFVTVMTAALGIGDYHLDGVVLPLKGKFYKWE